MANSPEFWKYPGGPWMDALAKHGDPKAVPFSFAQIKTKATGNTAPKLARETEDETRRFDLSFSGVNGLVRAQKAGVEDLLPEGHQRQGPHSGWQIGQRGQVNHSRKALAEMAGQRGNLDAGEGRFAETGTAISSQPATRRRRAR